MARGLPRDASDAAGLAPQAGGSSCTPRLPGSSQSIFHWGWGTSVLGLSGSGPVDSFVPVVMFSVLFGLSMDYLVFLVSRIQEEWHQLHHGTDCCLTALSGRSVRRNHQAVTAGLRAAAGSSRARPSS